MAADTCPDCHNLNERLREAHHALGARDEDGPLVYIAGPYRGDGTVPVETNVDLALAAFKALADHGIDAECPHLSYYLDRFNHRGDAWWLRHTMRKMCACTCVLRLQGASVGADLEVEEARRRHMPVYYSIAALVSALKPGE